MQITNSPAKKFVLMTGLVIVFLTALHFGVVPNLHYLSDIQIPQVVRVALIVGAIFITFAGITYANMFRPLVPGPSSWKQEKYWIALTIEKSLAGVGKLIYWVVKIFIFSVILYAVLSHTIRLYVKNIPAIMNGTYVYDKMEAVFIGAPLVMVFSLFLYISVKLYDHFRAENKKSD